MSVNYLPAPGEIIVQTDLKIPKAQEIATALEKLPFYSPLEFRRITGDFEVEVIVFDAEVEVGQRTIFDIRGTERIAVIFSATDDTFPEVLALREDFPKVPHLNLRTEEKPRSLCLFDGKYNEFKLHWTPTLFLERIREWLALTVKGKLHQEEQPLEPLLLSPLANLVIPFDLFSQTNGDSLDLLVIRRANWGENRTTFIAERIENINLQKGEFKNVAITIQGAPQPHGIIYNQPTNLLELHEFLKGADVDLLSELRERLPKLKEEKKDVDILGANLVLIINLPKTRTATDKPETSDIWAFLIQNTIREIGVEIGIWEVNESKLGFLISPNLDKKGDEIGLWLLNPTPSFSRELASAMNGFPQVEKKKILLIGGGALGSQVFINLIRMGFGKWTIVDEDCLLPHNLARHALPGGYYLGYSKAETLAYQANAIISGEPIAKAIVADVLNPSGSSDKLESIYGKAQIVIDASTSIPVARHIARDINSSARCISVFLNPSGTDVVMLGEDKNRNIPLDCLEMQYYRYLINEPTLENHLQRSDGPIRYARSCRDISNTIPQDLVALHAAICTRGIRNFLPKEEANISIWKADINNLSVKNYNVPTCEIIKENFGDWILYSDQWVLNKICKARAERLPNETGGVLIGSFDMQRKIVYVIDTILSPSDSIEWPTVYIRGYQGLKHRIDEIQKITARMLNYVGEWHSHPQGCDTRPGRDDVQAFAWLKEMMDTDGLPPLMMIVGEQNQHSWYLGQIG